MFDCMKHLFKLIALILLYGCTPGDDLSTKSKYMLPAAKTTRMIDRGGDEVSMYVHCKDDDVSKPMIFWNSRFVDIDDLVRLVREQNEALQPMGSGQLLVRLFADRYVKASFIRDVVDKLRRERRVSIAFMTDQARDRAFVVSFP